MTPKKTAQPCLPGCRTIEAAPFDSDHLPNCPNAPGYIVPVSVPGSADQEWGKPAPTEQNFAGQPKWAGDWNEDICPTSVICRCVQCGKSFIGHKRRVACRVCAAPTVEPASVTPATDEEIADFGTGRETSVLTADGSSGGSHDHPPPRS